MAKTLLNCVNEVLKRVGMITSDAGALSTLTSSALQRDIDIAVQVINEGIVLLYTASHKPMPNEQAESSFTLVEATRAYTLAPDLVQIRWPLIDKTNSQFITKYPGGYQKMLIDDPEQDDTGLPHMGDIRSTDGKLYLDRAPTSEDAGKTYTYQYDKSLLMTAAADTVPFSDDVFAMMVPPWAHLWKRERRQEFDTGVFQTSIGTAAQILTKQQLRTSYSPR